MKALYSLLALLALVCFVTGAQADEEKTVTLTGKICCCKCELKKAAKCATAIVVKQGGKDVVYVFDPDSKNYKEYHKAICTDPKEGTVKGTVKKDGEKLIITVTDLKFKE